MDARCILHHANRKARVYSSAAASEAMLIRGVLLFTGLEVRTELLLDGAAARGMCRREGVGTNSPLVNESSLATAVGETRSGHGGEALKRLGFGPKRKISD